MAWAVRYPIENSLLHGRNWFEAHTIAEPLNPPRQPIDEVITPLFIENYPLDDQVFCS
jgi:hypothetical protein